MMKGILSGGDDDDDDENENTRRGDEGEITTTTTELDDVTTTPTTTTINHNNNNNHNNPTTTTTTLSKKKKKKKGRIGIICGSGPEAGIDMFTKILKYHRMKLNNNYKSDKDAPDILMLQVSNIGGPRTTQDLIYGTTNCLQTWDNLKDSILQIYSQVDCFCICCHQLHFFENDIRNLLLRKLNNENEKEKEKETISDDDDDDDSSSITADNNDKKFVSFVQVTIDYLLKLIIMKNQNQTDDDENENDNNNKTKTTTKIAILGGPITTELFTGDDDNPNHNHTQPQPRSPYKQLVDVMPPDTVLQLTTNERNQLLDIIKSVKDKGAQEETKIKFNNMLQNLLVQQQQQNNNSNNNSNDGIIIYAILACTELPLLVDDDDGSNTNDDATATTTTTTTTTTSSNNKTIQLIDPTELVAIEMLNRTQQYEY